MVSEEHVVEEMEKYKENIKKNRNTLLDHFRVLTHNKEKIRLKSGIALLKHIFENKGTENGKKELKYALRRLIRGLGASKNTSKSGFYTVLVALFNCIEVDISEIFDFVKNELHSSGNNSKSENADILAGQILLYGAIIRTDLYEKTNLDERKFILEQLLYAGSKRDYLYLSSILFIIELCRKNNEIDFKVTLWPVLKTEFGKPWSEMNMDVLYLLQSVRDTFPNVVNEKYLHKIVASNEIHSKNNLRNVTNVVLNIPRITVANHPYYEIICQKLIENKLVIDFMKEIDQALNKFNHNRHLITTMLLTYIIKDIKDPNLIPYLLNKNYIQQTLQYFKHVRSGKNKEVLQEVLYNLFDTIVMTLKKDDVNADTKMKVLKILLLNPGIFIFEKITRSKMIQHIILTLDFEGIEMLGEVYRNVISGKNQLYLEGDEEKKSWLNNDRIYASQLLVKLFNHHSMQDQNDWKLDQLRFLMELSLFKTELSKNVGVELASSLKDILYNSLALKLPKLKDLRSLLSNLVNNLNKNITGQILLRNPLSDESLDIFNKSLEVIHKLESKHKKLYIVFHTLFLHMALELFSNVKLATDCLQELHSCYERIRTEKKHPDQLNVEDPQWVEVVVDLFLNLLSQNSYLLRNLINCVFPHLCKYINDISMQQILDILDPKNEANPLIADDSESDDESERSEEESSESDENMDEDEGIEDNVNDKLKMAVHMALGGYKSDEESVDIDDLSENEGKKLDVALSTAFKLYKPNIGKKPNKQTKEDEALTHFRIRILDLIDLYLDSEPSMYITLQIMIVLLRSLEFCIKDEYQRPLQNRLKASLKKLSNIRKFNSVENINDALSDLFISLLQKGTKNYYIMQDMQDKISECCLFIIKSSEYLNAIEGVPKKVKKQLEKVISKTITESLDTYFTKRESYIPYGLFKGILQLNWSGNYKIIPMILEYAFSDEVRTFRKNQALELIKIAFTNKRLFNSEIQNENLTENIQTFSRNVINILTNTEKFNFNEKYVRELITVLEIFKKSRYQLNWMEIAESLKEFRANVAFKKDTKIVYNKFFKSLGIDGSVILSDNLIKLNTDVKIFNGKRKFQEDNDQIVEQNIKRNKIIENEVNEEVVTSLENGLSRKSGKKIEN